MAGMAGSGKNWNAENCWEWLEMAKMVGVAGCQWMEIAVVARDC